MDTTPMLASNLYVPDPSLVTDVDDFGVAFPLHNARLNIGPDDVDETVAQSAVDTTAEAIGRLGFSTRFSRYPHPEIVLTMSSRGVMLPDERIVGVYPGLPVATMANVLLHELIHVAHFVVEPDDLRYTMFEYILGLTGEKIARNEAIANGLSMHIASVLDVGFDAAETFARWHMAHILTGFDVIDGVLERTRRIVPVVEDVLGIDLNLA